MKIYIPFLVLGLAASCGQTFNAVDENAIKPVYITDQVNHDSDDPAIWINPADPAQSLIYGTDKEAIDGGLYAFTLQGKKVDSIQVYPLDRPNNVDIAYGYIHGEDTLAIAVCTERGAGQIRVFSLPNLEAIDGGGLPVFEDDGANNLVMGVSIYTRPADQATFAIVSRKEGTTAVDRYLYQYLLFSEEGVVKSKLVRKFGKFSGTKEIEAVAVDDELGYVYYSDEHYGVRKYYADPDKGDEELAVFGLEGFADDREGISIYTQPNGKGYILVSNQGANQFMVFPREGTATNPHDHPLIKAIPVTAISSDGSEVTSVNLGDQFAKGLFVAMSDNKTFEIFSWEDIQKAIE